MCSVGFLLLMFALSLPRRWVFVVGVIDNNGLAVEIDKPVPVEELTAAVGRSALLECDLMTSRTADSAYLVLWYNEPSKKPIYSVDLRGRLPTQAKHFVEEPFRSRLRFLLTPPATLVLDNVTEADQGIYRCRVDFRLSPTKHVRYRLSVVEAPGTPVIYDETVRRESTTLGPYNEGSDALLACEVSGGGPNVQITWWRGSEHLYSRPRPETSTDRLRVSRLELRNLGRKDHGSVLTCRAEAGPGVPTSSSNVSLRLHLRPATVEISSHGTHLESGKLHEVVCKSAGAIPPAVITWWAGNKQLERAESSVSEDGNTTISILSLIPSPEDDGKILTCRAQTPQLPGGVLEDSWRMQIHYIPRVSLGLGPGFHAEEIRQGEHIYLECHVRANPYIHRLLWYKNGLPLTHNTSLGIVMVNQSLVLRDVGRHTAGNYSCVATNRQGETASQPLQLHVKYAPVCRTLEPQVVVVSRDEPALLRCQVEAEPPSVAFRWTLSTGRETALVPREAPSDAGLSSVLEYIPRRDADFGLLQCWASNSVGNQKEPCIFNVTREGVPLAPSECSLQSPAEGVLEVVCSTGTNNSKYGHQSRQDSPRSSTFLSSVVYILELYDGVTGHILRNVTSRIPRFNVSDIDPKRRVSASVTAVNRQGRSEPVTLEGAVERAVGSRTAEPAESMTMIVLLAVPASLLVAIAVLAGFLALYHRRRRHVRRPDQQQQQATRQCQLDKAQCGMNGLRLSSGLAVAVKAEDKPPLTQATQEPDIIVAQDAHRGEYQLERQTAGSLDSFDEGLIQGRRIRAGDSCNTVQGQHVSSSLVRTSNSGPLRVPLSDEEITLSATAAQIFLPMKSSMKKGQPPPPVYSHRVSNMPVSSSPESPSFGQSSGQPLLMQSTLGRSRNYRSNGSQ